MDSLSTLLQGLQPSGLALLATALVVTSLFWWRAGCAHAVLERLWRLVAGKADAHTPVLKSLLLETRDVEKFQFTYRLKAETLDDVRRYWVWTKTHRVGMARLQKIRRWVDIGSPQLIVEPPRYFMHWRLLVVFVAAAGMLVIAQLAASRDAYFQTRASQVWFKTDGRSVTAPLDGWSFSAADCRGDRSSLANVTGFTSAEVTALCESLDTPTLKSSVTDTVKLQDRLAIVGVIAAIGIALANVLAADSAREASLLRKRLGTGNSLDGAPARDAPGEANSSSYITTLPAETEPMHEEAPVREPA